MGLESSVGDDTGPGQPSPRASPSVCVSESSVALPAQDIPD